MELRNQEIEGRVEKRFDHNGHRELVAPYPGGASHAQEAPKGTFRVPDSVEPREHGVPGHDISNGHFVEQVVCVADLAASHVGGDH